MRQYTVHLIMYHRFSDNSQMGVEMLYLSDENSLLPTLRNMTNIGRLQFVAIINFSIETFLRKYVRYNGSTPEFSYSILVRQALKLSGINSNADHDSLIVLSMIRNTFHDAGTHSHSTNEIDLKGVKYTFNQRDYVRGDADWDQIAHASNCALSVVYKIVGTISK